MKPLTANELRIGNYIATPSHNTFRIDEMEYWGTGYSKLCMRILEGTHPLTWQLSDCSPIHITEEWLVKFGFEATTHGFVYGGISVGWQNNGKWIVCIESMYKGDIIYCSLPELIESVHQLQNVFYALTGEELTLNSNPTHQSNV